MRRFIWSLAGLLIACPVLARDYDGSAAELARFAAMWEQARAQGNLIYGGTDAAVDVAYFQGFTMGVALSSMGVAWCPKQSFSMVQIWAIVATHLRNHPASWNGAAQAVVSDAFRQAYPCEAVKSRR